MPEPFIRLNRGEYARNAANRQRRVPAIKGPLTLYWRGMELCVFAWNASTGGEKP